MAAPAVRYTALYLCRGLHRGLNCYLYRYLCRMAAQLPARGTDKDVA
jgi:hypothetical protein